MKRNNCFTICSGAVLTLLVVCGIATAQEDGKDSKNACSQSNPASLCNAGNTCGSASTPCDVDLKRTSYSSSATPNIANAKANALFCVKTGTIVKWQSTVKDTGFLVDLGKSSPFEPSGIITGGTDKSVSVVAKTPGCFNYNFSASDSQATYGMSKAAKGELIVTGE